MYNNHPFNYPWQQPMPPPMNSAKEMRRWFKAVREAETAWKNESKDKKEHEHKKPEHNKVKGLSMLEVAVVMIILSPFTAIAQIILLKWTMHNIATLLQ